MAAASGASATAAASPTPPGADVPPPPLLWHVQRKLRLVLDLLALVPLFAMVLLARLCPPLRRRFEQSMARKSQETYTPAMKEMVRKTVSMEELSRIFYSNFAAARQILHSRFVQNACAVRPGGPFADAPLHSLATNLPTTLGALVERARLTGQARAAPRPRPLVLNFGSCT